MVNGRRRRQESEIVFPERIILRRILGVKYGEKAAEWDYEERHQRCGISSVA